MPIPKANLLRITAAITFQVFMFTGNSLAVTLNLRDFDAACGEAQHNCRLAFQTGLRAVEKAGGGTLVLPPGNFLIDFPDVANDAINGPPIQPNTLISVPSRVTIQGHLNPKGVPDSIIEWKITSVPVFVFASSSFSGMRDLHLRFIGSLPTRYPYGDIELLKALGFYPTFPHYNQMSGGNYEMSSAVYLFNSEHCTFDTLIFDSQTQDNNRALGIAININGAGLELGPTSGLSRAAEGNTFTNIVLRDYLMGIVPHAQSNVVIENIDADWRGSSKAMAPGHVIYFTAGNLWERDGSVKRISSSKVTVRNITEGPHTLSNVVSFGTLALKYINGGSFQHVFSQHPAGLIQSMLAVQNVSFEDMRWSTDYDLCGEQEAAACGVPVINCVMTKEDLLNGNDKFTNVAFKSTIEPIFVQLIGSHFDVNGITIETPPTYRKGQTNAVSALLIKDSDHIEVKGYSYIPRLTSVERQQKYNTPVGCFGTCSDVHVDANVKWPKGVPHPPSNHALLRAPSQDQRPDVKNSLSVHVQDQ